MIHLVKQQGLGAQGGLAVGSALLHLLFDFGLLLRDPCLPLHSFGYIQLRGEEELDLAAFGADRAEVERIPEGRAVVPVVEEFDIDVLAGGDGVVKPLHGCAIRVPPRQLVADGAWVAWRAIACA